MARLVRAAIPIAFAMAFFFLDATSVFAQRGGGGGRPAGGPPAGGGRPAGGMPGGGGRPPMGNPGGGGPRPPMGNPGGGTRPPMGMPPGGGTRPPMNMPPSGGPRPPQGGMPPGGGMKPPGGHPGYNYGYYPGNRYYGPGIGFALGLGFYGGGYGYPSYYGNNGLSYYYDSTPVVMSGPANQYVTTSNSADGPTLPPPTPLDPITSGEARITVVVPTADAQVWFNDTPTTTQGKQREFRTAGLEPNKTYKYTIRAQWQDGGKMIEQTRIVPIQVGQMSLANFGQPELLTVPPTGD